MSHLLPPEDIFLENDTLVILDNLVDVDGVPVNDAVVTATLFDVNDVTVPGGGNPLTLAFVSGSSGKYEAVLDKAVEVEDKRNYNMKYVAIPPGGDSDTVIWKKVTALRNFV